MTNERDFLEFRMIAPKLMSFTGDMLKLDEEIYTQCARCIQVLLLISSSLIMLVAYSE